MVAVAVVSAPVALEVCQIACESKAMTQSMPHGESHAGHHHVPAEHSARHEHSGPPQLSPASVPCDHGTEATPSLVTAKDSDAAVSLLAVLLLDRSIATVETGNLVSVRQSTRADRLVVPLAIPLRV
jgi:hypothetical protein